MIDHDVSSSIHQFRSHARLRSFLPLPILQPVVPPAKEWLEETLPLSVMRRMLHGPRTPSAREDLVILPIQIQPGMDLDEEVDKHRNEAGPGEDVAPNDIQGEIGQQDQRDPFCNGEAVRDLGVNLIVLVVWAVNSVQSWDAMEEDMDHEE